MRVKVNGVSPGLGILIGIIKLLIAIMGLLMFVGFFLLRTAGGEYFKELKNRKTHSVAVTATVKDVDRNITENMVTGYQILSYDYNGQTYESKMEYYIEGHSDYSSDGSEEKSEDSKLDIEKSEKHWQELKDTIGKEETVLIDPNDPSSSFIRTEDHVMRALGIMTLIGILPFIFFILLIIALVLISKKIIKKSVSDISSEY